jgi:hypothetical protein
MAGSKVEYVGRELIEKKILSSLEEGDKVALLVTKLDLEVLIAGLEVYGVPGKHVLHSATRQRARIFLEDLQKMHREVFE